MSTFILRPYFFEEVTEGDLQMLTVTSSRYLDMLALYAIPELQRQTALSEVVWMQDGAPPHVGSSVKRLLSQHHLLLIVICCFCGHQGLLTSHQWVSVCGDT